MAEDNKGGITLSQEEYELLMNQLKAMQTQQEQIQRQQELMQAQQEQLRVQQEMMSSMQQSMDAMKEQMDSFSLHFSQMYNAQSIEDTLQAMAELGKHEIGAEKCTVYSVDPLDHSRMFTAAQNGERSYFLPSDDSFFAQAIQNKQSLILEGDEGETLLFVPLESSNGEVIGLATAQGKEGGFTQEDIKAFSLQEGRVGNAFRIGLENKALQQIATTDKLTSLQNREGLEDFIRSQVLPRVNHDDNVSVIMFDIDHFKRFNDTYGHDIGDKCLKAVADTLRDNMRQTADNGIFRWGGEEMVAVVPVGAERATEIANRLRQEVEKISLDVGNGEHTNVTVSGGVAQFDKDIVPNRGYDSETILKAFEDTLKLADEQLYVAKESGRNQIQVHLGGGDRGKTDKQILVDNVIQLSEGRAKEDVEAEVTLTLGRDTARELLAFSNVEVPEDFASVNVRLEYSQKSTIPEVMILMKMQDDNELLFSTKTTDEIEGFYKIDGIAPDMLDAMQKAAESKVKELYGENVSLSSLIHGEEPEGKKLLKALRSYDESAYNKAIYSEGGEGGAVQKNMSYHNGNIGIEVVENGQYKVQVGGHEAVSYEGEDRDALIRKMTGTEMLVQGIDDNEDEAIYADILMTEELERKIFESAENNGYVIPVNIAYESSHYTSLCIGDDGKVELLFDAEAEEGVMALQEEMVSPKIFTEIKTEALEQLDLSGLKEENKDVVKKALLEFESAFSAKIAHEELSIGDEAQKFITEIVGDGSFSSKEIAGMLETPEASTVIDIIDQYTTFDKENNVSAGTAERALNLLDRISTVRQAQEEESRGKPFTKSECLKRAIEKSAHDSTVEYHRYGDYAVRTHNEGDTLSFHLYDVGKEGERDIIGRVDIDKTTGKAFLDMSDAKRELSREDFLAVTQQFKDVLEGDDTLIHKHIDLQDIIYPENRGKLSFSRLGVNDVEKSDDSIIIDTTKINEGELAGRIGLVDLDNGRAEVYVDPSDFTLHVSDTATSKDKIIPLTFAEQRDLKESVERVLQEQERVAAELAAQQAEFHLPEGAYEQISSMTAGRTYVMDDYFKDVVLEVTKDGAFTRGAAVDIIIDDDSNYVTVDFLKDFETIASTEKIHVDDLESALGAIKDGSTSYFANNEQRPLAQIIEDTYFAHLADKQHIRTPDELTREAQKLTAMLYAHANNYQFGSYLHYGKSLEQKRQLYFPEIQAKLSDPDFQAEVMTDMYGYYKGLEETAEENGLETPTGVVTRRTLNVSERGFQSHVIYEAMGQFIVHQAEADRGHILSPAEKIQLAADFAYKRNVPYVRVGEYAVEDVSRAVNQKKVFSKDGTDVAAMTLAEYRGGEKTAVIRLLDKQPMEEKVAFTETLKKVANAQGYGTPEMKKLTTTTRGYSIE